MVSVFLSHSKHDKPFVRELANFLTQDDQIHVWLDEREIAPGDNIVGKIQEGLDADVILLILSPDSVDSQWVKEEWTEAFWEQTYNQKTKLVGVHYRDCDIPRLLRNKSNFDLRRNHPEGFRKIRTWLLGQHPAPPRPSHLPARSTAIHRTRRRTGRIATAIERQRRSSAPARHARTRKEHLGWPDARWHAGAVYVHRDLLGLVGFALLLLLKKHRDLIATLKRTIKRSLFPFNKPGINNAALGGSAFVVGNGKS